MPTCPMCAEDVATTDAVCPHCGSLLAPSPASNLPRDAAPDALAVPKPARSGGARQWVIPGVLAVALVLALVVKFAWWERRWQGTSEACEVVTALTAPRLSEDEMEQGERAYFAGDHNARSRFVVALAGELSRLHDVGTLRTRGVPVETVERLYVGVLQPRGVTAGEAHTMFVEHRREILRAAGADLRHYQTPTEVAGLRTAAAACSSGAPATTSSATGASASAITRPAVPAPAPVVAPSPPPPAPVVLPSAPPAAAPQADAAVAPPNTVAIGERMPPPCVANCIRAHRTAYVRCADACVRQGDRGAECNQECGRDYDHCLNDECHFDADGTPWFRPDMSVPAEGADTGACTYATHDSFHLRASPTASRAGAVEITTSPVVELLHAERLRRGHERLFRVRLPDGRDGWMFVPEAEVPTGCEQ